MLRSNSSTGSSPHVTFSASDGFQKSSNVFNQPPDLASGGVVSGGDARREFFSDCSDRRSAEQFRECRV